MCLKINEMFNPLNVSLNLSLALINTFSQNILSIWQIDGQNILVKKAIFTYHDYQTFYKLIYCRTHLNYIEVSYYIEGRFSYDCFT